MIATSFRLLKPQGGVIVTYPNLIFINEVLDKYKDERV
jgi:hypothetical protein